MLGDEKKKVNDTLIYRDMFVSVFIDTEKCLMIMVNVYMQTKVRNIDSNYACIEDDIADYYELLNRCISGRQLTNYLNKFIHFVCRQNNTRFKELNKNYLQTRGIYL